MLAKTQRHLACKNPSTIKNAVNSKNDSEIWRKVSISLGLEKNGFYKKKTPVFFLEKPMGF